VKPIQNQFWFHVSTNCILRDGLSLRDIGSIAAVTCVSLGWH